MKVQLNYRKKMWLVLIVSTIGTGVFSTITSMILSYHDVPRIDYRSFLGEDMNNLYLLCTVFWLISVVLFVYSGYNLIKIIVQRQVEKNG